MKQIIFTCGDINGIGPEICVKTINKISDVKNQIIILICPKNVLENTFRLVKPKFSYSIVKNYNAKSENYKNITIIDIGDYLHTYGVATKDSGAASYKALSTALKIVRPNVDALITAPISKNAFHLAGIQFPGHTELLAKHTNTKDYLMVFLSNKFICGLTTIHEPIKNVASLITKVRLKNSIIILNNVLENDLKLKNPVIAVLGLNPHAGENGAIGNEENKVIKPVIDSIKNIKIKGPFVPDAFFANQLYKKYDAVLGMYHDQVLIPFKMLNFNNGVNYTAGLPIVRTSPDHGTGYDIAGKGIANSYSMEEAVKWANLIVRNRKLN